MVLNLLRNSLQSAVLLSISALLLAALVACGGDGDDDAGDTATSGNGADAPQSAGDRGSAGDESDDGNEGDGNEDNEGVGGSGFDFGSGLARVTIDGTPYEFDLNAGFAVCRDVFDAIQVSGAGADGAPTQIDMWIPPTDWESYEDERYDPPNIEVEDETSNTIWIADLDYAEANGLEGQSQVDSYDKDGLAASGSATFHVRRGDAPSPVEGTFEVSCEE